MNGNCHFLSFALWFWQSQNTTELLLFKMVTFFVRMLTCLQKGAPKCSFQVTNLNRLKLVLVEKNKTGKWLSEQLGKSTCTVSKWCKNTVQPDLNTLDKIAKLLDVDVKYLLNDTEK